MQAFKCKHATFSTQMESTTTSHTHTHTHTQTYIYAHTYTNIHIHTQTHIYTNTNTHIHTQTHIYTNTDTLTQTLMQQVLQSSLTLSPFPNLMFNTSLIGTAKRLAPTQSPQFMKELTMKWGDGVVWWWCGGDEGGSGVSTALIHVATWHVMEY